MKAPSTGFWHILLFVGLMGLGAFLRLYSLGSTYLWIDEITVFMFGEPGRSFGDIIGSMYRDKFAGFTGQHMPLQYLIANMIQQIQPYAGHAGDHFLVRLPYCLLGIASLPFVYMAALRAFGRTHAFVSLFLVSISFFHVYMSRDATSYAPLLFFLSAHFWALTLFTMDREPGSRRRGSGVLLVLTAFGALFSHMTAWLLLGAEGVLLGGYALWRAFREEKENSFISRLLSQPGIKACLLIVLATIPLWPLVFSGIDQFSATTDNYTEDADRMNSELLLYQLGFFGWGRSGGRLIVYSALLGLGVIMIHLRKSWRLPGLFMLLLVMIVLAAFAVALNRNFAPRYLSVVFYPLVGLVAMGITALLQYLFQRVIASWVRLFLLAVLTAGLVGWHTTPYLTMYKAGDKCYSIKPAHQWLLHNTPPGGLYVFRNSFYMREIPGTFPVPGRYTATSEYNDRREYFSLNTRSYFERFPLAVLLVMPDSPYESEGWPWIVNDFKHVVDCGGTEYQKVLWDYGFWPHGYKAPNRISWRVHYNTESDVVEKSVADGRDFCIIPQFGGWGFAQDDRMRLYAVLLQNATVTVYNLKEEAVFVELRVSGMAQGRGSISIRSEGKEGPVRFVAGYNPGVINSQNLGRHYLKPGRNDIEMQPLDAGRPSLYIYSLDVIR